MKCKYRFILLACILLFGCAPANAQKSAFKPDFYMTGIFVKLDTLTWTDNSRGRIIPVTIYNAMNFTHGTKQKLVILNPGYGGTRNGFRDLATNLATKGYLVITIQHDLATDDSLPKTDDIYKLRKPFWDRGIKSIFFAVKKLQARYPDLDYKNITLIGYANGGDIAMFMANEAPQFAKIVIAFDNCSVPIPRSRNPKILSIRSPDQPADAGVLPSTEEQKKYRIKIVNTYTIHNIMRGDSTQSQNQEVNSYILNFLNENL